MTSKENLVLGGRPIPECSMVNWLFDLVVQSLGSYQISDVLDAFDLLAVLYKLDTASYRLYTYVLLSLEGCTTGLISVDYLHFL